MFNPVFLWDYLITESFFDVTSSNTLQKLGFQKHFLKSPSRS